MSEESDGDLTPLKGESARAYTERLNEAGISRFTGLETYFGFSAGAAKGMWVASERFNARWSFEQWSERRSRSSDGYGARNWVKRKYGLTAEQADAVEEEFENGNADGLLSVLTFEDIARSRFTGDVVAEMETMGAFAK